MTQDTSKTRETRLRRMARRQGLRLEKSRLRDVYARDFGTYRLGDARTGQIVTRQPPGQDYGATLDDVEERLTRKTAH